MDNKNYNILIVDDEPEYQKVLSLILQNAGYSTATCSNGEEALEYLSFNDVKLVITDLRMPVMSGDEMITHIREQGNDVDILVVTAYGSIESAVDAIKKGATDYFLKSDNPDELIMKIKRLEEIHHIKRKSEAFLRNQNSSDVYMSTKNENYQQLLDMCLKAADTSINILLLGESGVGKEVVAKFIHRNSKRRDEPFVPVNCQEYPENLIESELFGHEKGAFTGAIKSRVGKFEEANYGTLFLDEIGDLPMSIQSKLLRVLESKTIERVGSNKRISLDVRFIFATNKNLTKAIKNETFREDLFYRINTLTVTIPALRHRREDLPDLIKFFVKQISIDQKKEITHIDDDIMHKLLTYDYPGNIRELKNIIERMIALSTNGKITSNEAHIFKSYGIQDEYDNTWREYTLKEARNLFEKQFIEDALKDNDNNVSQTARKLQISSRQLWNKINQYNILLKNK